MKYYQIDCEECDETTYVGSYKEPIFCSACGEKIEAEEVQSMETNQ